jgi:hypothetical protein
MWFGEPRLISSLGLIDHTSEPNCPPTEAAKYVGISSLVQLSGVISVSHPKLAHLCKTQSRRGKSSQTPERFHTAVRFACDDSAHVSFGSLSVCQRQLAHLIRCRFRSVTVAVAGAQGYPPDTAQSIISQLGRAQVGAPPLSVLGEMLDNLTHDFVGFADGCYEGADVL